MKATIMTALKTLIVKAKTKMGIDPIITIGKVKMVAWFNAADNQGNMRHEIEGQRSRTYITASEATLTNVQEVFNTNPKWAGKVKLEMVEA